VRAMGWAAPDHVAEDTVAKYGHWCMFFIFMSLHVLTAHQKVPPARQRRNPVLHSGACQHGPLNNVPPCSALPAGLECGAMCQLFHFNIFVQSLHLSPEAHLARIIPNPLFATLTLPTSNIPNCSALLACISCFFVLLSFFFCSSSELLITLYIFVHLP